MSILQEANLLSPGGASRYPEPRKFEFATPKAHLFHSLKYRNKSLMSVSGRDRMSASDEAVSEQTCSADTSSSHGFSMLLPLSHVTTGSNNDSDDCDTSGTAARSTNRLLETTPNPFTSPSYEACADQMRSFQKSSSHR